MLGAGGIFSFGAPLFAGGAANRGGGWIGGLAKGTIVMRKGIAILVVLALATLPAAALAQADGELLYNGDFSQYQESAELPSGWEFEAYDAANAEAYVQHDAEYGTCVVLHNSAANDARVYQNVPVEPDTVYEMSALVRTADVSGGTGASLSIDNYSADGTYCYSENLHGSNAWRRVTMYVRTGEGQTTLRAALRLGGYGTTASGEAAFCGASFKRGDAPSGATVINLATENGTVSHSSSAQEEPDAAVDTGTGMFLLIAAVTLLCAGLFCLLYRRVLRYDGGGLPGYGGSERFGLPCVLVAAFVLRLALSVVFYGHPTDINCFMAWGNALAGGGFSNFYTSGMFADYPPGYMYLCGFLSWVSGLLGLPYGSDAMAFLFKLPATLADLFSAYFVYRIARQRGLGEIFALVLAAVLALNPVLMFVSGAWGQIDTLLTLLLVLTCHFFLRDQKILAGAIYGVAILFKPQALMLGPILAVAYLADCFTPNWKRALTDAALAVAAALAALFVLSLPFKSTQPWDWLVEKYQSTAASYPYASIEAFNLFSMLGGNWKAVESTVLGLPFSFWGPVGIGLSVAFSAVLYWFGRKSRAGRDAALYLAGAVLIAGVFTLGHYMHERYLIPALMLLMMAYLCCRDRRVLVAYGALSVSALLNVLAAMYIINRTYARGAGYELVTFLGSLIEVASFAYLAYLAVDLLLLDRGKDALAAPQDGRETTFMQSVLGNAPLRGPVLPEQPYDRKLHYSRRDWIYLIALTVIYGVVALTNLGSLKAPQTDWQSSKAGETITVQFDRTRHVKQYWVNGNIQTGGTLLINAGAYSETFEQTYDDMFRWKAVDTDFTTNRVELILYSGSLRLNEIAFFDASGELIPVRLSGATKAQAALFDEQDTVPDKPSYFNGMYFDELYHARTAYEHLHNLKPYENSHPPLGKLFIMLGVAVFGMCPFGWRVVGALFGVGMLPVLYVFARRIFKKSEYALLAAGLFAFDFMHFTQTRIATIDVYAVFFILLMYYYMYQYIRMNFFVDGLTKTWKPLFLSGLFFGVGTACKWTCIYAGAGLAVLFFGSLVARYYEYLRLRTRGSAVHREQVSRFWSNAIKTCAMCCLFFIAIPFAIYFLSYLPYYLYEAGQSADSYYGLGSAVETWRKYQEFMYSYHSGLNATHPYQSMWYEWPFTIKPMWYYFNSYDNGSVISTLTASGNPAVWWVSTLGAAALLAARLTNRIKPDRALQILCVGVLANYLPWVLVSRCTFIYHFFATVPFLILAAVYGLEKLDERYEGLWFVKWAWLAFAVLFFVLLYPGLSGLPIPAEWAAVLHQLPGGKLLYGAP